MSERHRTRPRKGGENGQLENSGKGSSTVGTGDVPWGEYIALMKGIGYDGRHAIEDESGVDVVQSVRRGREFLERY